MLRLSLDFPSNTLVNDKEVRRPYAQKAIKAACLLGLLIALMPGNRGLCAAPGPYNGQLETIIKRELPPDHSISIQVVDFTTGSVLMEKNPDLPLVPASTMKVVTSSTALQVLNPEFHFITEIYVDSARSGTVGNIYLRGSGDPHLVSEELFRLTRDLKDRGLRHIKGNIVVDESHFSPDKPLDENEKLGVRAYHAPYSAASLNFNALKIVVVPGFKVGDNADIVVDPMSEYARVKGQVKTVKGAKPAQIEIEKKTTADDREIIQIDGTIGIQAPLKGRYVNIGNPPLYLGEVFKEFLLREGIRVGGKVVIGQVPTSATLFLEFPSLPLGLIVYWLDKHSSNFMAEQLNLAMGAQVYGAPGTREEGLQVIKKHLENCGVDESTYSLSEASGLSRNNRLSASALVKVLLNAAHDFSYNAEFMASLGIAGVDGTLKEKFTDPSVKRRLRAKTGTLRGVNALTGFGVSVDGRPIVFAVLVNSEQKGAGLIDYGDKIMRGVLEIPMSNNCPR